MSRRSLFCYSGPTRSQIDWRSLLIGAVILPTLGCGSSNPGTDPQVKTAIGTLQSCFACSKEIPNVQNTNTVVYAGAQYFVCNDDCSETVKQRLQSQGVLIPNFPPKKP